MTLSRPALAVEVADAERLFRTGDYAGCVKLCEAGVEENKWLEAWWLLKVRAELATGNGESALKTYETALERHAFSLPLRWLGVAVYRANGKAADAEQAAEMVRVAAERTPRRLEDVLARVAAGRAFLASHTDAKTVLEQFFDKAKKDDPRSALPHLATGDLAMLKGDYALAADSFREAIKRSPEDPDGHLGLARAFAESDTERMAAALAKALELNPRHVDSLLLKADNEIDREDYANAEKSLAEALAVNPKEPRAHAYRAVLAHLAGEFEKEKSHRAAAMTPWESNPEPDHLIGRKLSAKYRFAEGSAYQRKSLEIDQAHRPANVQLAQDLLRLGKDEEGWKRVEQAATADPYDVVAYNLVTLRDTLASYRTLKNEHFIVRMDPREADIYGERTLALLERARQSLVSRYGAEAAMGQMGGPITVEIFPRQADFAIRTFGLPGGAGFLGVCFGPVITVNSPASRLGSPNNWEAVVWHEYCHSVTLARTKNKMPRWLSEGISVYEERRANPAWGQAMNPRYRELILAGEAKPVSQLSGAFLRPRTPMHLQFAYYQSSLVVQYIVDRFGAEALNKVLGDLGEAVPINAALAKHTEPIEQLDAAFDAWIKEQANALGKPEVWEKPELDLDADSTAMKAWNAEHPGNFWGLLGEGRALVAERKFSEAKAPLERAAALWPACGEPGGPYLLLAAVARETGDPGTERKMLEKHVSFDADVIEPRLRLVELASAAKDWPAARRYADEIVAVNPLLPAPHRSLADAADATKDRTLGIAARKTLLKLDPLDKAEQHYRLGRLLADEGDWKSARRQAVMALEEAPRYREAHRLLLEAVGKTGGVSATQPATPAASP